MITEQLYWSSGQLILGILQGTAVVAIYAIAIQLKQMYYMFSTAISAVFLPRVTYMITKGVSEKEVSDLFIKIGRVQFIVMAFILTGFILLGKPFIYLWAGSEFSLAYPIALLFFIPTFIPLIQNIGITILMAYNQLKFRSLLILATSVISLLIAIPFSLYWGALGCAAAISISIAFAYGLIMNIYYHVKIHIDIKKFWKEIGCMAIVPLFTITIGYFLIDEMNIGSFKTLGIAVFLLSIVYIPSFYYFSMNKYERDLFTKPLMKIVKQLKNGR